MATGGLLRDLKVCCPADFNCLTTAVLDVVARSRQNR